MRGQRVQMDTRLWVAYADVVGQLEEAAWSVGEKVPKKLQSSLICDDPAGSP